MPDEKLKTYEFPVCLLCEQEIDESNEHRHQGPTHDIQRVQLVPLETIRERLRSSEIEDIALDRATDLNPTEWDWIIEAVIAAAFKEDTEHGDPRRGR